uniref:AAA+ ATPase domain-containing protein n=2 Tax=root TaxID=1 RepID=A0AAU8KVR7_9VIRU
MIIETLLQYYAMFIDISQKNMVMGGAIGMAIGGVLWTTIRGLPSKIVRFTLNQFTVSLHITNTGNGLNEKNFDSFMEWYIKQPLAGFNRRFSTNVDEQSYSATKQKIGVGFGLHFFLFKGRLFWFVKARRDSQNASRDQMDITIRGLSRSSKLIIDLVDAYHWRPNEMGLTISHWDGNRWGNEIEVTKRDINTVILRKEIKEEFLNKIEEFYSDRKWYDDRGLPYKFTCVLTGPPGTGKTSISKAIASHFNKNVSALSLASMTNDSLRRAFTTLPKGNILLIEDFDDTPAVKDRVLNDPVKLDKEIKELERKYSFIDLIEKYPSAWVDLKDDYEGYSVVGFNDTIYIFDENSDDQGFGISAYAMAELGVSKWADEKDPLFTTIRRWWKLKKYMKNGITYEQPASGLTLSALLNGLDGIVPLDETMTILTTNHPENIDKALLRKGRVDYMVEIPYLRDQEVREYIKLMFPDFDIPEDIRFKDQPGCDVMAAFSNNRYDPNAFINSLLKY